MSCQVEQIADCGDISSVGRALFIPEKEDSNWLSQCSVSLSSCGSLLAVGYRNRLCLLTTQWISAADSNSFLISWSGTLSSDISAVLALPICPTSLSSQNGPDWLCVIVGFVNGSVGFYTNTGHLLLLEKFDDKAVLKISCHTGTYGILPDDIQVLFQSCVCIISGPNLFKTLRQSKAQLARVHAGVQPEFFVDSRNINVKKWLFTDQEIINDAVVVGLDLKNTYDHLLAASTYGGYDVWYRSVPPVNSLIIGGGVKPYLGFHYALEGGTTPPLQDVARAVANKIKSALPGWLGGGPGPGAEARAREAGSSVRADSLRMRGALADELRAGTAVALSPDRRLAAAADSLGRVAVYDVARGHLIRMFKGYRDAQCAFVQIFETDGKKPHLSTVKELNRAIFLIIYNPKKGLIDIRLMQRGNRVAVFTATKNGQLIYNTCGLVGAEKNYSNRKLNLPQFQCVLIDPDGKLKKFDIPFYHALEGEHSERSRDLCILRELRNYIKKTSAEDLDNKELIIKASELTTLPLKKHCIEMFVRNYDIPPGTIMQCLSLFWESLENEAPSAETEEIKQYFAKLALVTLFYRHINNETIDDMQELITKVHEYLEPDSENKRNIDFVFEDNNDDDECVSQLELLEDDGCVLERLLHLTQDNNYKEQTKVTFADSTTKTYKEFTSCFDLDEKSKNVVLKSDTPTEKLNNLAAFTFKSIFKRENTKMLHTFIRLCKIDPKDIIKLLIMQIIIMPWDEINIDLIEKLIKILYYICSTSGDAIYITYNEISPWWQNIRDILVEMECPLKCMIIAMACKAVGRTFEEKIEKEDIWESVTQESAKWGILIGKLEDISILSIVLMCKEQFVGETLPKLETANYNINLQYIYSRGQGSVTELIAKWLCSMGVLAEAVMANELLETYDPDASDSSDGGIEYIIMENNREHVEQNPKIFKWLSLLRRQFPLSTSANYIIGNMCWEYAMAWQKNMQDMELLNTIIRCLKTITDLHIRLGLFCIIWSTYIKHTFEISCKLVNKVGRLPKDPLCYQDLGFGNDTMIKFLETTTKYLNNFLTCSATYTGMEKRDIQYEKIWDESMPSLVEVAQNTHGVCKDILNLNLQISCTIYYQIHFNIKFSKPLDMLYDIDYQYIFDALTGTVQKREISMTASEKIRHPRMKFLTKLIRSAVDTITTIDSGSSGSRAAYNDKEFMIWIEKISLLAELWKVDYDFMRKQQIIALYHMGYDTLTEYLIDSLLDQTVVLTPLLAISIQRLKRSLERSSNQPEWIVTLAPHLYKRLQTTVLDPSIPANPCLETTASVLKRIVDKIESKSLDSPEHATNIKLAQLIIENSLVLFRRKL